MDGEFIAMNIFKVSNLDVNLVFTKSLIEILICNTMGSIYSLF